MQLKKLRKDNSKAIKDRKITIPVVCQTTQEMRIFVTNDLHVKLAEIAESVKLPINAIVCSLLEQAILPPIEENLSFGQVIQGIKVTNDDGISKAYSRKAWLDGTYIYLKDIGNFKTLYYVGEKEICWYPSQDDLLKNDWYLYEIPEKSKKE